MRAVIADDEELVRFSVRDMLSEIQLPVTVVGEVEDGASLVDLCLELQPDLAIVDVRMPRMSGLEAIESLHDACPNTEWVILTSYSEFEYARRALNIGAVEYLLKPVGPEELSEALEQVARRRAARIRSDNDWFENRVTGLLSGIEESAGAAELSGWEFAASLILVEPAGADSPQAGRRNIGQRVQERLSDLASSTTRIAVTPLAEGIFSSVIGWRTEALERGTERSFNERHIGRLSALAHELREEGVTISVICSNEPFSFSDLGSIVSSLRALAPYRLLSGFGSSTPAVELSRVAQSEGAQTLTSRLDAVRESWQRRRALPFERALKEVARLLEQSLRNTEIEMNIRRFLSVIMSREIGPIARMSEWLPEVRDELNAAHETTVVETQDAIEQTLGFLEENYAKNISIAGVALSLGLTPNYLSALFHKRVGTTFSKYLTQLRMERAREILMNSSLPVGEVATRVGYASARHFARTFRSTFDRYPSEIKRSKPQT